MKMMEDMTMKEVLTQSIISNIKEWVDDDIYAISLFVSNQEDNPCRPTVTLGYNTETQVQNEISNADDEREARWNYAFWLQNEFVCFGQDETLNDIIKWLEDNQLPNYEDDDVAWDNDATYDEVEVVTKKFVMELIDVVKEIHQTGILKKKYGKEIPIIIHELEYYDEIAEQNIEANGRNILADFVDFCIG